MHNHIQDTKRVAKNTLYLYGRSLLALIISLYTSRVILNILGISDYGIYNAVGGMVAMFQIMSATFTSSTQRFITFELGKKTNARSKEIFSSSLNIHILIAIIILIVMETAGVWFLNCKMNIPAGRMVAANWVFQCSVATFIVNLISIPYNASIIAHEKMGVFALISIYEVISKLILVLLLRYVASDRLILFAIFILAIAISVRIIYGVYCKKRFQECKWEKTNCKETYKEMLAFSGWSFFGSCSSVLSTQGLALLLNIFWGVIANAAKGISLQVERAVTQLVNNFMTSLNPLIIKSYSAGEYNYMMSLAERGGKFSFYLMALISLPIIFETETILQLWLGKNIPEYTTTFIRLSLIYAIMQPFSNTMIVVMQATGKIKTFQLVIGWLQLLNFPAVYVLYKLGFSPEWMYYVIIANSVVCIFLRIRFVGKTLRISMKNYINNVIIKSVAIVACASLPLILIRSMLLDSIGTLLLTSLLSSMLILSLIYLIGLRQTEKLFFIEQIKKIRHKLL